MPPSGPQALFVRTFNDVRSHADLDAAYNRARVSVESHLTILQRGAQVRVRAWLKKLGEETANVVWKKNRNAYARLLLDQLRCGRLAEPFNGAPPDGPLATLPKHTVYPFRPPRSVSPTPHQQPGTAEQQQQQQERQLGVQLQQQPGSPAAGTSSRGQQAEQQWRRPLSPRDSAGAPHLSASEQLDEYLGRGQLRRLEHAAEQQAAASCSSGPEGAQPDYLPGTRMQLRGAEALAVDRQQLNDVGWQPSKLELQAELGASRERQRELEWHLRQSEEMLLRQQAHHMQAWPSFSSGSAAAAWAQAPTLLHGGGGLLAPALLGPAVKPAASDPITRALSPPRQQRRGTKELDELVSRFDAKQQQQKGQQHSRGAPALRERDEEEMLLQLDAFQQTTEAIRLQLGGPPSSSPAGSGGSSFGGPLSTHTPRRAGRQQPASLSLFDGLPPTPMHASGSSRRAPSMALNRQAGALPAKQAQSAGMPPGSAHSQRSEGAGATLDSAGAAAAAASGGRLRSPIGPDVRHTLKSAAAAAAKGGSSSSTARPQSSSAALQRLREQQAARSMPPSPPPRQAQQQQQQAPSFEQPVQQPAAAAAPQYVLPPDSNAALAAEVRQLRDRLLQSMQKYPPGTTGVSPYAAPSTTSTSGAAASHAATHQPERWQLRQPDWRGAEPAGSALGSSSKVGLGAGGTGGAGEAATPSLAGASRFRLTDDSSKFRLSDPGQGGGGGSSSKIGAAWPSAADAAATPTSRWGGTPSDLSRDFSLDDFQQQTEALRQRISGMGSLDL